jgi:putative intracellular protease/amidase
MISPKLSSLSFWLIMTLLGLQPTVQAEVPSQKEGSPPRPALRRAGVLSSAPEPGANTSQGLYLRVLREAGWEAAAVSPEAVKSGALEDLELFIIGGGSGTKFNTQLGKDGCAKVTAFVRNGGGVLASCAGGYSFVRGHNEALSFLEIANAHCVDTENGRWARGKGVVEIAPSDATVPPISMFYANGPIWEITDAPGFGLTKALATFVTDIKKEGDAGGVMPGTPAILGGTFGSGRYVLFSAHPEFQWKLGCTPLIVDAANWVVRGPLQTGETLEWKSVFPSEITSSAQP